MSNSCDNWCPEVYRSVFIDRYNNDHVRVAPCCQAKTSVEPIEQFDFVHSPTLNRVRQQFSQGLRPVECNSCWAVEAVGHKSRRLSAIEFFNLPTPTNDVVLESIDHSATWACNMACIMCGPDSSSLWAKELDYTAEKLAAIGRKFQKDNNILNQIDVGAVKKIHFNGGEPMLNNHQVELLEKLAQQDVLKNTFISYNTNASTYPDDKIIEYWRQAKLVKLFFSIDATGPAFNYIRWPGDWNQVQDNINRMKESLPSNVMFGINLTVGAYNLLEIMPVWQWFQETIATNRQGDASDFCWQVADNFNPAHVVPEVKQAVVEQLSPVPELSGIVDYVKSTLNYTVNDHWITKLDNLDVRRNQQWRKVLKIAKYY